jgi:hypothetical protein
MTQKMNLYLCDNLVHKLINLNSRLIFVPHIITALRLPVCQVSYTKNL